MTTEKPLFVISQDYLLTIGATILLGSHYVILGLLTSFTRRKYFPQSWMEENFGKEHQDAFGEPIGAGGYPDVGEGRYAKALGLRQWEALNNALRGFQNYKENITMYIGLSLLSGLFYPLFAAGCCVALLAGRVMYAIGYGCKGANWRVPGAAVSLIALLLLMGSAVYGSAKGLFA